MEISLKHCKALELHKVLELLAQQTVTAQAGERALHLTPITRFGSVTQMIANTADALSLGTRFGFPSILRLRDCSDALERCELGAAVTLRDFLDIAAILRNTRTIQDWKRRCETACSLDGLFELLVPNKSLEERIAAVVASEDEVLDTASDELLSLRRKIRRAQLSVREQLERIVRSQQKYLQEQIITMRDGRYVVPVRSEYRNEIKGLVHDTSASGATLFVEPIGVVEANNEVRVLLSKEKQEIERILQELSAYVGGFAADIREDYNLLVDLDLLFAKAKLADAMRAHTPELDDTGATRLVQARHPLIAREQVVPIDLTLGEGFDTLVITGPNTGGKTVALKTVGLFVLMTMCGLLVPAQPGSRICIYQNVLVDIGDEQSIEQSLSTFSSHITNIIEIIKLADTRSLVLLDELGAGTDPVEGAALAVSIIERLREQGAKILATTHYPEMKLFALQTQGVENGSCEFDVATLKPTYRLLIGIPGRSNAFAISERLGLPPAIIERAKEHVSGDSRRFEDVVSELNAARQALEQEQEAVQENRARTETARREIQAYQQRLEKRQEQEIEKARNKARRIVDEVTRQATALIDELSDIKRQQDAKEFSERVAGAKGSFKANLRKLQDLADPVTKKNIANYQPQKPFKRGDLVIISSINREGTLLSDPDKSGEVTVQAGIIKTKVNIRDLRHCERTASNNARPAGSSFSRNSKKSTAKVESELDMRGMNVEEGLMEVDRFIDSAVLMGLQTVSLIHGKGTGVLRSAVQSHLRRHPSVRSFRLGVYGEGESGVTIVELK